MAYRSFNSLVKPKYADGVGCPRKENENTSKLPPARLVSRVVHHSKFREASKLSDYFVAFGQSQAHDTGITPVTSPDNVYNCPMTQNDKCRFNISVPKGDKFLPENGCTWFPTAISYICNGKGKQCGCTSCSDGQLQFQNEGTSFLDGSTVYGSSESRSNELREPETAKLRMDGELLARTKQKDGFLCGAETKGCDPTCFDIGDGVGNLDFPLQAVYTIWYREHNRLVDKLQHYFSDKDVLFNEVRKIIIAMIQHVAFNEYLPLVFGKCMHPDLKVPSQNADERYDPTIDPTTFNECNTAACRYGHTEIRGFPKILGEKKKHSIGKFGQMDMFCNIPHAVNKIVGGLVKENPMEVDEYVDSEILNKATFVGRQPTDVIALGIFRSRVQGLATYVEMFEFCGLKPPKTYDELREHIADEAVEHYRQVYGEDGLANIELYSAILSEKHIPGCGGIVGTITSCLVAEHHRRHKWGDRLWYENLNQPESLTKDQLKEIQKTTLARILCSNTNMTVLQERAFQVPDDFRNMPVSCQSIIKKGDINASKWK